MVLLFRESGNMLVSEKRKSGFSVSIDTFFCSWHILRSPAVKDIRRAVQIVKDEKITVLVSLGGGSPIDAAKVGSVNCLQKTKPRDSNLTYRNLVISSGHRLFS